MNEIFISYSHKDSDIQQAVVQKLEENGLSCWYAPRNIQPGEEWAEAITNALRQCRMVVLIFTENSNTSVQVLREVSLSVDFRKNILPFKCDNAMPIGSMQYYLSTLHWLDASGNIDGALDELVELTKRALNNNTQNAPDTADQKKKRHFTKMLILIIVSILLITGILFTVLLSRSVFNKNANVQDNISMEANLTEEEKIYNALLKGEIVPASGEDPKAIDFYNLPRRIVLGNKLYYFSPGIEPAEADDYLYAMLDDNSIMLTTYTGEQRTGIMIPNMVDGLPVSTIGNSCFQNNTNIQKVTMPETVDTIEFAAFSGCENLHEVIFSEYLAEIGEAAFAESGLVNVVLPESVTSIGNDAFYGCDSLQTAVLPKSVTLLPQGIFQQTQSLQSVTIMAEKVFIDSESFDPGADLTLIGIPGSYTEKYAKTMGFEFIPYTHSTAQ